MLTIIGEDDIVYIVAGDTNETKQHRSKDSLQKKHCSLSAVAQYLIAQYILWKQAFQNDCTTICLACTLTNKQQCNPENSRTEFMELKEISEERNHKSKSRKDLKENFQGRKDKPSLT